MIEEWKDIVIEKNGVVYNYTNKYQVSNFGRLRALNFHRSGYSKLLKLRNTSDGYLQVGLRKDGKQTMFRVHRLVANAFIENPNNLPVVNHKDENKQNNNVDNLEWCTVEHNNTYGSRVENMAKTHTGMKRSQDTCDNISKSLKGKNTGDKNPRAKKVMCIETGYVFTTVKDAAQWCNLKWSTTIIKCCKGEADTAGGFHWKYVEEDEWSDKEWQE